MTSIYKCFGFCHSPHCSSIHKLHMVCWSLLAIFHLQILSYFVVSAFLPMHKCSFICGSLFSCTNSSIFIVPSCTYLAQFVVPSHLQMRRAPRSIPLIYKYGWFVDPRNVYTNLALFVVPPHVQIVAWFVVPSPFTNAARSIHPSSFTNIAFFWLILAFTGPTLFVSPYTVCHAYLQMFFIIIVNLAHFIEHPIFLA